MAFDLASDKTDVAVLTSWGTEQATALGYAVDSVSIVRAQPWAIAMRLDVSRHDSPSVLWAKTIVEPNRFEIDVVQVLGWCDAPSLVRCLASDRANGLLLLEDGGPMVSSIAEGRSFSELDDAASSAAVESWHRMLTLYGRTQRASAAVVDQLLEAGCLDLRSAGSLAYYDRVITDDYAIERFLSDGVTPSELDDLRSSRSRLADAASALAMSAIAPTIQHDDLGPSNVCVDGRVIDWGDASVAHPFASLLTALYSNTDNRPGIAADRRIFEDVYLSGWLDTNAVVDDDDDLEALRAEVRLACELAPLGRIASWLRAPRQASVDYPGQLASWVRRLIDSEF